MEANGISLPRALKLFFLSVTVISVLLVGLLLGFFWLLGQGMCGNHLFSQTISPDGRHKVVVFERSCGASTGFSTHLSLIKSEDNLANDSGNILILKGHPDEVAPTLSWLNNHQVKIHHRLNGKEYKAEQQWSSNRHIQIQYLH
ncbi:hypothetical protein [Bowmanella denitrificans]|uniref:hypothetical protein n=1 Tax=Bowmanella denitrificans TaxID=366582 RepID=UPI000C99D491|nr:hypothetical protein [Bowmanella denitrificans]